MLLDKEIGHEIHQKNHCSAHWNSFLSYIAYFLLGSGAPLSFFGPILSGYTYLTYVIITTILGACIAAILKLFKLGFTKKKTDLKSIENLCDPRISSFSIFEHWSDRGRFCSSWINIFDCRDVDNGSRKQKSRYLFVCSQSCDSRDPFRFSMGRASTCIILKDVSITL